MADIETEEVKNLVSQRVDFIEMHNVHCTCSNFAFPSKHLETLKSSEVQTMSIVYIVYVTVIARAMSIT